MGPKGVTCYAQKRNFHIVYRTTYRRIILQRIKGLIKNLENTNITLKVQSFIKQQQQQQQQ